MTKRREMIGICFGVLSLVSFVVVPAVHSARNAARGTKGSPFVMHISHVGPHPEIVVHVNPQMTITKVDVCPLCYRADSRVEYRLQTTEGQRQGKMLLLDPELIAKSQIRIKNELDTPEFIQLHSLVSKQD